MAQVQDRVIAKTQLGQIGNVDSKIQKAPDHNADGEGRNAKARHQLEADDNNRNIVQERANRRRGKLLVDMADALGNPR